MRLLRSYILSVKKMVKLIFSIFERERLQGILIVLFFGIIIFLALTPFFFGRILFEDDVTYYYIPAFKFYSEAVKNNQEFSITPQIFSGFPLHLSQVGGFYEPINFLIFKYLPFPLSYNFRILINYWLSAVFTYFFIRALGLSKMASFIASFSFITAQNIIPGMNILRSNSFFIMPGLFYVLIKLYEDNLLSKWKPIIYILLGSSIFSLGFLGGYTQLSLYATVAAFLFFIYLNYKKFSWRFVLLTFFSFLLGILIFLPHLLRVLEYIPSTGRSGGLSWDAAKASGGLLGRIQNLSLNLFLPPFHFGTLQSLYIGSLSIFFFFYAFLIKKNNLVYFFIGLFLFSLLSSFPYPLFWIMNHLPFFKYFRFPPHWLLISSFAMSVLAAFGYEFLRDSNKLPRLKILYANFFPKRIDAISFIILFILVINFLIPAWVIAYNRSFDSEVLLETPAVIESIIKRENNLNNFRIFNFYPGDSGWFFLVKPFDPSRNVRLQFGSEYTQTHLSSLLWGVSSIRGFDYFVPRRYQQVLSYIDEKNIREVITSGSWRMDDMRLNISSKLFNILSMMNVKYIFSIIPLSEEYNVSLIDKIPFAPDDKPYPIQIYLYENKQFFPRVFVPSNIEFLKKDEGNFDKIIKSGYNFEEFGFIECDKCDSEKVIMQSISQLEIIDSQNNLFAFSYKNGQDAWVIISNSFVPGWKAFIDDIETEIYYANYIYQGIKVPKGEHVIRLKYK